MRAVTVRRPDEWTLVPRPSRADAESRASLGHVETDTRHELDRFRIVLLHESGRVSGSFGLRVWSVVDGFEVDVERAAPSRDWWGRIGVEELPVGLDVEAEVVAVVDLVPVEVLVLQASRRRVRGRRSGRGSSAWCGCGSARDACR